MVADDETGESEAWENAREVKVGKIWPGKADPAKVSPSDPRGAYLKY